MNASFTFPLYSGSFIPRQVSRFAGINLPETRTVVKSNTILAQSHPSLDVFNSSSASFTYAAVPAVTAPSPHDNVNEVVTSTNLPGLAPVPASRVAKKNIRAHPDSTPETPARKRSKKAHNIPNSPPARPAARPRKARPKKSKHVDDYDPFKALDKDWYPAYNMAESLARALQRSSVVVSENDDDEVQCVGWRAANGTEYAYASGFQFPSTVKEQKIRIVKAAVIPAQVMPTPITSPSPSGPTVASVTTPPRPAAAPMPSVPGRGSAPKKAALYGEARWSSTTGPTWMPMPMPYVVRRAPAIVATSPAYVVPALSLPHSDVLDAAPIASTIPVTSVNLNVSAVYPVVVNGTGSGQLELPQDDLFMRFTMDPFAFRLDDEIERDYQELVASSGN